MSYAVAIPSAGRPAVLARKTLPMLRAGGVPLDRVTVYVPNEGAAEEYRAAVPGVAVEVALHDPSDRRLDLVGVRPLCVGLVRNLIVRSYPPGARLLFVDDDIAGLVRRVDEKRTAPVEDVHRFVLDAFAAADRERATLWGIYPVKNPYFMRPGTTSGLCYVPGAFYGVRVTGAPHELVVLDDKEDFERSIRHYLRDGRLLRYGGVSFLTEGYAGAGGMQLSRSRERAHLASLWLVGAFPELCSLNTSKKSGWTEVRLKDRRGR